MVLASDIGPWLIRAVALLWGAIWGSFFNVAIHRWPREMSVVTPPSHCPACGEPIAPVNNIPVLGWVLLRGRAACCGTRISGRYPLVELTSALLCVALAEMFIVKADADAALADVALETLFYFFFVGGLLVASFVDLDFMEIPDEVSLPGAALGLATVSLRESPGAVDAAIGAGVGFLVVQLAFVWAYERLTGRRGMGEGDAKLLMMIGAFLGWQGAIFALVFGAFQGLVVAGLMLALGKKIEPAGLREWEEEEAKAEAEEKETGGEDEDVHEDEDEDEDGEAGQVGDEEEAAGGVGQLKVPYGPFLALGALEFLFFGGWLVERYLDLFL